MYPTFSWEGVPWNHHFSQSVAQSVTTFSQKRLIGFLWNLVWSCGVLRVKNGRFNFSGKKSYFGEKVQKYLQNSRIGWFGVYKMFNPLICAFFGFTWNNNCLYDSAKTICLGKIWLYAKMPLPNQIVWFFKFEYPKSFLKYEVFFCI